MHGGTPGPLGTLGVVSAGQTLNDLYSNFLPQLLPFLIVLMLGLTATQAALLVVAILFFALPRQPGKGKETSTLGLVWKAIRKSARELGVISMMLLTGALGGVAGGFISDRWGRKPLIVGSLVLATPLFLGFLATQGALSLVFLALSGAALLSSFSVTTVAAQEAIPEHKAMAGLAGLFLQGHPGHEAARS